MSVCAGVHGKCVYSLLPSGSHDVYCVCVCLNFFAWAHACLSSLCVVPMLRMSVRVWEQASLPGRVVTPVSPSRVQTPSEPCRKERVCVILSLPLSHISLVHTDPAYTHTSAAILSFIYKTIYSWAQSGSAWASATHSPLSLRRCTLFRNKPAEGIQDI